MPPKKLSSPTKGSSHAVRAAALLSKARAQASSASAAGAKPAPASTPTLTPTETIPLPTLIKQLSSKGGLPVRDAMSVAGKLINARCNTQEALSQLSLIALQEMGVDSEDIRKRAVLAFKGKRAAGLLANGSPSKDSPKRKRSDIDDEILSKEYGNVKPPDESSSARRNTKRIAQPEFEYVFHEILSIDALRGRYAVVNRAPVMTVWATILLERLDFSRPEALSLAHCYVNYTSTMRGISLGIIPESEREKASNRVGPNQPHFELMGVKIPVMQMRDGSYRGISGGEVVGPEKAFNYMRRSMAQTLASVFGALTLLADSYMEPPPEGDSSAHGAECLNAQGYSLYAEFRPSTSGEWGKKGRLWYDKILALRRGHEHDLQEWKVKEERLTEDGPPEEEWSEDVERLVQEELEKEAKMQANGIEQETAAAGDQVKAEGEDT